MALASSMSSSVREPEPSLSILWKTFSSGTMSAFWIYAHHPRGFERRTRSVHRQSQLGAKDARSVHNEEIEKWRQMAEAERKRADIAEKSLEVAEMNVYRKVFFSKSPNIYLLQSEEKCVAVFFCLGGRAGEI